MKFGCAAAGPCTTKVQLTLADGQTAMLRGVAARGSDAKPFVMLLTPHAVRSSADLEAIMQARQQARAEQRQPQAKAQD